MPVRRAACMRPRSLRSDVTAIADACRYHSPMRPEAADRLTPSDRRLLEYLREGRFDAEIAVRLGISIAQVKARVELLRERSATHTRAQLAAFDWSERVAPFHSEAVADCRRPADGPEPSQAKRGPASWLRSKQAVWGGLLVLLLAGAATWAMGEGASDGSIDVPASDQGVRGTGDGREPGLEDPNSSSLLNPAVEPPWDPLNDFPPHADHRYHIEQASVAARAGACGMMPAETFPHSADPTGQCDRPRVVADDDRPPGLSPVLPPANE